MDPSSSVRHSLSVIEQFTHTLAKTNKRELPQKTTIDEVMNALKMVEQAYNTEKKVEKWQIESVSKITNMLQDLKVATEIEESQKMLGPMYQSLHTLVERVEHHLRPFEKKGTRVAHVSQDRL